MTEAVRTSETSLYSNETTRRYIPEGCHLLAVLRMTGHDDVDPLPLPRVFRTPGRTPLYVTRVKFRVTLLYSMYLQPVNVKVCLYTDILFH
jgi:hypothetical protein